MANNQEKIQLGLVSGRHPLPVEDYIFQEGDITFPINPSQLGQLVVKKFNDLGVKPQTGDFVVYVTGLTPATTAVIRTCLTNGHLLTLKHYDRDSDSWIDDPILTASMVNMDTEIPTWLACP